jgi:EPS-associated MarR family transcriptional regulator
MSPNLSAPHDAPPSEPDADHFELLRLLEARSQLTQREVASSLGVSLGKANYVLRALIERGLVKVENYRKSGNKAAYLYLLTPKGIARKSSLTRRFLARKVREYEALRLEIERLRRESGHPDDPNDTRSP